MARAPVTERQRRFAESYVENGGNGEAAAVSAGYSVRSARSTASRLLTKVNVARTIREFRDVVVGTITERTGGTAATLERYLLENQRLAFVDPADLFTDGGDGAPALRHPVDMTEDVRRAIASIKVRRTERTGGTGPGRAEEVVEVRLWDKGSAIDRGVKALGGYPREVQVSLLTLIQHIGKALSVAEIEALAVLPDDQLLERLAQLDPGG